MQRGLTIAIALILVLFLAAIITVYVSIGSVIGDTIASRGSAITQTGVTVGEVEYSANTGLTTISDLKIGNPAGFKQGIAINFSKVELWIDPQTINTPTLHVKALTLVTPEIIYEIRQETDNLRTLRRQVEYSTQNPATSNSDKKFFVENIQLKGGTVFVEVEQLNGNRQTATLRNTKLPNIGTASEGASAEQMVYRLLLPLLRETTLAALNTDLSLPDQARNLLSGAIDETENAINALKNLLK
jgi:hypothetical protein